MTRLHGEEERSDSRTAARVKRPGDIIPLCFTYFVVISSWAGFTFFIVIKDSLIYRVAPLRAGGQFTVSSILFGLTIISLLTASTRSPGHPDPSLTPEGVQEARQRKAWDDDDIPLGRLRNGGLPTLNVIPRQGGPLLDEEEGNTPSTGTSGFSPKVSPFPLQISPFVPSSATDAGEESDEGNDLEIKQVSSRIAHDTEEFDEDDSDRLLGPDEQGSRTENLKSLFAKNSSGGHRWCSKCDAWKPDRCHHCRYCKRCTLKMDHHCIWIGTCVGYNNYKSFLLFVIYGTLLAFFIFIESCISMIHYFTHPDDYTSESSSGMDVSEITPVSFMLLTFIGVFFTLTIGGLAGYHCYLVCNNRTTLEDMTHAYPSALIEDRRNTTDQPGEWRGDHLLSRPKRVRLREEASKLNVYDLGWRRNIREILIGPDQPRKGLSGYFRAFWPLSVQQARMNSAAGHHFGYDPVKLERLQELTAELRLGRTRRRPGGGDGDDDNDEGDDDD